MLTYHSNASKMHRDFGQFLLDSGYGGFTIKQEVPVLDLCCDYFNGQDRYDYYIKELQIVVELHGAQHYKPVTFGKDHDLNAQNTYIKRVTKDSEKKTAALRHGLTYVVFAYNEPFTKKLLLSKVEQSQLDSEEVEPYVKPVDPYKERLKQLRKQAKLNKT